MNTKLFRYWASCLLPVITLSGSSAWTADTDQGPVQGPVQGDIVSTNTGLEIGGGLELQVMEQFARCTPHCGESNWNEDKSRSGGILEIGFKGIQQAYLFNEGSQKVVFIPISVILDSDAHSASFGRVKDYEKQMTRIRQITGTLLESTLDPNSGLLQVRGKLARATFDRDKGIWDWRALDASVGIAHAWMSSSGNFMVDLNVQVGSGVGGVRLNNFKAIENALDKAPVHQAATVLSPFAMISSALQYRALKLEWVLNGERRIDLTPAKDRAVYMDNRLSVSSHHINTSLDLDFILSRLGDDGTGQRGRHLSLFLQGQYDLDELTLSNMFFRNGEDFRSFTVIGGVRAQF